MNKVSWSITHRLGLHDVFPSQLTQYSFHNVLVSIVGLIVAAGGCAAPTVSRHTMKAERIIADEPTEFFSRDSIITRETVVDWDLGKEEGRRIWAVNLPEGDFAWTSNGLEVDAQRRYFSLTAAVEIDASTVDVLEVEAHDLYKKPMTVSWASVGGKFSDDAQVFSDSPVWSEGKDERYRLVLKGHPKWKGRISRLKVAFVIKRTNVGTIHGMSLSKERLNNDAVARVAALPWIFEVDNEVRPGWIGIPGTSKVRSLTPSEGTRLRFGIGSVGRCSEKSEFEILLTDRHQQESTIFSESLVGRDGVWSDREVDLSAWAGQEIVLRFQTTGGRRDATDIPVWGNPVIVTPGDIQLPNILLIDLDTLRADHMSIYGYGRSTTPMIDAWAAKHDSVVFENAVAAAPWTLPSHVSMFTAIDAHRHGVNQNKPMPTSMLTLAEILRGAGYATIAVTGGGFVHQVFGFSQGFDEYRSFSDRMGFENEIEVTTRETLKKLARHKDRPFFLFYHTYEIHNPYRPRMPWVKELSGRETEYVIDVEMMARRAEDGLLTHRRLTLGKPGGKRIDDRPDDFMEMAVDLYDAGIAYADSFVGHLLDSLDEMGLAENTIVVITSDHGELFGEHGEVNHYCVYDQNVHVPLIIAAPGASNRQRRFPDQVRSIDLMPTLLDLVGLAPPEDIDGVTLREVVEGGTLRGAVQPAFSYASGSNFGLAIREGGLAYIFRNGAWHTETGREEYFRDGVAEDDSGREAAFDSLRTATLSALDEFLPGLRIVVSNAEGPESIEGVIRGPLVGVGSVKIHDFQSGSLRRTDDGGARFSIEPGRRASWIFEGLDPAPLFLQLGEQHFRFDIAGDQPIQYIGRSGNGWAEAVDTDSVTSDGVYLWRMGAGRGGEDARALSEDVRRQLEVLGYVE